MPKGLKSAKVGVTAGAVLGLAIMWIGFQVATHGHTGILRTLTGAKQLFANASGASQTAKLAQASLAGRQHSVTLSWKASPSPGARYNVYRRGVLGGPTRINPMPVPVLTYNDDSVQSGQTYFYTTRAVSSGVVESTPSNEVRVDVPSP